MLPVDLKTTDVARAYATSSDTIRKHFKNHNDEFLENVHYFYDINPRFQSKVIKWTLEAFVC